MLVFNALFCILGLTYNGIVNRRSERNDAYCKYAVNLRSWLTARHQILYLDVKTICSVFKPI